MMIHQILTPERIIVNAQGGSKKKVLELVANRVSQSVPEINAKELFDALIARERFGTTGLGNGIAIPHCRCKACPAPIGLFMRLAESVDFDSVDRDPVDIVFALIAPEGENQEHLEMLQMLAKRFRSEFLLKNLRTAIGVDEIYQILEG